MTRDQFNDFDSFLAAAEVTGTRFGTGSLPQRCAIGAYAESRGIALSHADKCDKQVGVLMGMDIYGDTPSVALWQANDRSRGDPAAVRRRLHELFPEYVEPSRTSLGEPAPESSGVRGISE